MPRLQFGTIFRCLTFLLVMSGAGHVRAQQVVPTTPGSYETPFDSRRGVYSYADAIDSTYPSIVRINYVGVQAGTEHGGRRLMAGNGSGVIFDVERGLILTNSHVVKDAALIGLELFDGRLVDAELVGFDSMTDLAVLKADISGTKAAAFVDSRTLRVGDVVFAVGFPRGLDRTVSMGVISGMNRQGFSDQSNTLQVEDFIQTDAAINPGNSGGPLFDSRGRVVGINTFIFRESTGLGFAVPSNVAVVVARELAENGSMRRGRMGVGFETLTQKKADALGVQVTVGALITSVEAGSAAEAAGLQVGDVVTGAGEIPVRTGEDLVNFVLLADLDQEHRLFVHRGANIVRLSIRLMPIDAETEAHATPPQQSAPDTKANSLFGARLEMAGGNIRIAEVADDSPASRNGLKVGDLIVAINRQPVSDIESLMALIDTLGGEVAALSIKRGETVFLTLFKVG